MSTPKLLFIVGSQRKQSFNKTMAEVAAKHFEGQAEISFLEYGDVPFVNQDIEFPPPASVTRVREEVMTADALWIVTPEYNHEIAAQLKNLIDWLSRPLVKFDYETPRPLTGKPVAISSAAGAAGGIDGRTALEKLLVRLGAKPVGGPGEGFVLPKAAFVSGVYHIPEEEQARLFAQGEALLAAVQ